MKARIDCFKIQERPKLYVTNTNSGPNMQTRNRPLKALNRKKVVLFKLNISFETLCSVVFISCNFFFGGKIII